MHAHVTAFLLNPTILLKSAHNLFSKSDILIFEYCRKRRNWSVCTWTETVRSWRLRRCRVSQPGRGLRQQGERLEGGGQPQHWQRRGLCGRGSEVIVRPTVQLNSSGACSLLQRESITNWQ